MKSSDPQCTGRPGPAGRREVRSPAKGPQGLLGSGWVPAGWGVLFALGLLKFGNPVVMEKFLETPSEWLEWVLSPWPTAYGYGVAMGVLGLTVLLGRRGSWPGPWWLMGLPLMWFGWQCVSALFTVDGTLTRLVLPHFAVCAACFYAGAGWLGRWSSLRGVWVWVLAALLWVIGYGVDQRFRGLPETRAFILQHEATHWRDFPAEERKRWEEAGTLIRTPDGWKAHPKLLEKASSLRISSTLFYPNTLAGALLMMGPVVLWALGTTDRLTPAARVFSVMSVGAGCLACLYWSGSKAGWLIGLGLAFLGFWAWPWPARVRLVVLGLVLGVGLTLFAVRYAGFFQRGAPSVAARWDYWRAAWQTAWEHPWVGTGPGTFQRPYERIKPPEAEMARLTHNDYLQQASDSGWPAALAYTVWVVGVLVRTGRQVWSRPDREPFFVWLGLVAWAAQSFVEFNLYIPGLAWPAFALAGWLMAVSGENQSTEGAVGR
ncbi:O-antigen ligase family protein [Limisphaera ngatamarikiensis]|uniref:O-antigen ligase family protein n=1 Tax=Limisphaera ngatamarikiensis TaxID=1324935 RepID=UPI0013EA0158|nr:O-antigen ligase family protein [Limisphaera ngatamarikiensis]